MAVFCVFCQRQSSILLKLTRGGGLKFVWNIPPKLWWWTAEHWAPKSIKKCKRGESFSVYLPQMLRTSFEMSSSSDLEEVKKINHTLFFPFFWALCGHWLNSPRVLFRPFITHLTAENLFPPLEWWINLWRPSVCPLQCPLEGKKCKAFFII